MMIQKPIALKFKNRNDFQKALERLWMIREDEPNIQFAIPPAENTFIISKKHADEFSFLHPQKQAVERGSRPKREQTKGSGSRKLMLRKGTGAQ